MPNEIQAILPNMFMFILEFQYYATLQFRNNKPTTDNVDFGKVADYVNYYCYIYRNKIGTRTLTPLKRYFPMNQSDSLFSQKRQ